MALGAQFRVSTWESDPGQVALPPMSSAPWTWRLENAAGEIVTLSSLAELSETSDFTGADQASFPTQSDAESWVGEEWQNLLSAGVVAVTLFDGERLVYGPMSLLPPD